MLEGAMRKEIGDTIAQEAERLDELKYQAADVLDVKASIILVVVTFLGTLSGQILSLPDLPTNVKVAQIVAVVADCLAGMLTLVALWPRDFDLPPSTEESVAYVEKLEKHFDGQVGAEDLVFEEFRKSRARGISSRIKTNSKLVAFKSRLNHWTFYIVSTAVAAELVSLAWLVLRHLRLRI
jgi:hypothetical protein